MELGGIVEALICAIQRLEGDWAKSDVPQSSFSCHPRLMSATEITIQDVVHLTDDAELQKLFVLAMNVRNQSYSPYSKFRVGACLLTSNGEFIPGALFVARMRRD